VLVVLTLLLQSKVSMETLKYGESAKINSGSIREIDIAVSKESLYNTRKSKKLTGICVTAAIDVLGSFR
jgi:hypothetical protein